MYTEMRISDTELKIIELNANTVRGAWMVYLDAHLAPMAALVSRTYLKKPYMSHFTGFDGYGADLMDQLSGCLSAIGGLLSESVVKKHGLETYGCSWSNDPKHDAWLQDWARQGLAFICRVGGFRCPKGQLVIDMMAQVELWMLHAQDFFPMDVSAWRIGNKSVEMQRDVSRMVERWANTYATQERAQKISSDLDNYWSKFNEIRLAKFERMLEVMRMETHVQGGAQ